MSQIGPSPLDPLGHDMLLVDGDLDPSGRAATGEHLVEEAIRARLLCSSLFTISTTSEDVEEVFGEDVRLWVQEVTTPALAAAKAPRVTEALLRDERISAAPCTVTLAPRDVTLSDGSRAGLIINISAVTTTGATLERIVGVSQISVEFLQGS